MFCRKTLRSHNISFCLVRAVVAILIILLIFSATHRNLPPRRTDRCHRCSDPKSPPVPGLGFSAAAPAHLQLVPPQQPRSSAVRPSTSTTLLGVFVFVSLCYTLPRANETYTLSMIYDFITQVNQFSNWSFAVLLNGNLLAAATNVSSHSP